MRSRHSRLAAAGLSILLAACASGGATATTSSGALMVDTEGKVMRQSSTAEGVVASYTASRDKVWNALVATYTALGIGPTVSDPVAGRYGNAGFVAPKRINDVGLNQMFRCETGGIYANSNAESGRLVANVMTYVTTVGTETRTETRVSGRLTRNDGASSDPIDCATTGRLEGMIGTMVQSRLAP